MDEHLITHFVMVTNLNEYITDYEEFREEFGSIMEGKFEHDLCNKILVIKLNLLRTTLLIKEVTFGF